MQPVSPDPTRPAGRTRRTRWCAAGLAVALFATGCTGATDSAGQASPPQRRLAETLQALPFGDVMDIVTDALTQAGVGVSEDGAAAAASPVRLTRWQVRNLAVEAANGGGIAGATLAAAAPMPDGMPAMPYLVAAWAKVYDSAGARFARELMGEQDWPDADRILFPNLVLTLFLADATAGVQLPESSAAPSLGLAGVAKEDACTFGARFVQGAIADFVKALKVDTSGGGFLGFLGTIWNVAVELAASAVRVLVKQVTQPVLNLIADVFGVVALIVEVSSFVVKWRAQLRAEPSHSRFGVDSEIVAGRFQLVLAQQQPPIPDLVIGCAAAVGVDLRNAGSAAGSRLTWTERNNGRADLSTRTGADDVLGRDKTASYRYQTGQETAELARSSQTESPALQVSVRVHRNDVAKVRELFTKLLFDQIPQPDVRSVVERIARPRLDQVTAQLAALTDVTASSRTFITHHVAEPSPSPSAPKPGSGPGQGVKAVIPVACPHVSVITDGFPRGDAGGIGAGAWEFDGQILPPQLRGGVKSCGYTASLGQKDPVSGFQQVEQVGLYLYPHAEPMPAGAKQTSVAGADMAWFDGILMVVVGDRTLGVEVRARDTMDPERTALAVARSVLGVG